MHMDEVIPILQGLLNFSVVSDTPKDLLSGYKWIRWSKEQKFLNA